MTSHNDYLRKWLGDEIASVFVSYICHIRSSGPLLGIHVQKVGVLQGVNARLITV